MILRAAFYQDPTVAFLEPLTQMSVQIFSRDLIFVILPVNIMHPSNYNKLKSEYYILAGLFSDRPRKTLHIPVHSRISNNSLRNQAFP